MNTADLAIVTCGVIELRHHRGAGVRGAPPDPLAQAPGATRPVSGHADGGGARQDARRERHCPARERDMTGLYIARRAASPSRRFPPRRRGRHPRRRCRPRRDRPCRAQGMGGYLAS